MNLLMLDLVIIQYQYDDPAGDDPQTNSDSKQLDKQTFKLKAKPKHKQTSQKKVVNEYIDTKEYFNDIDLGNGQIVAVNFKNTNDKKSSDNCVEKSLVDAVEGAVKEANKITPIFSITISATTNGKHSNNSNHYESKAVDIFGINDKPVLDNNTGTVAALQDAFDNQSHVNENFGPSLFNKNHKDNHLSYSKDASILKKEKAVENVEWEHCDHIHFSVH